jgi:predicted nucleic acid-binding protein
MILADSCVIIDYLRNPTSAAKKIFSWNEIAICGVVKAEVLRGASSSSQFSELEKALECFENITFEEEYWVDLAQMLNHLKSQGVAVPFQDAMIALLAIKSGALLWTADKHFQLIKSVFPSLSLFKEELSC